MQASHLVFDLKATTLSFTIEYDVSYGFFFYLRERGREGEIEWEKHRCARDALIGCLSHAANWVPGLQPRHVPWLGIQQRPFLWWAGTYSTEPYLPGQLSVFINGLYDAEVSFYCRSTSKSSFSLPISCHLTQYHIDPWANFNNSPMMNWTAAPQNIIIGRITKQEKVF